MSECNLIRYLYLAYFSKPIADRHLYRGLRKWHSRSIVELGLGEVTRTLRLLEVAKRYSAGEGLRYTAIDLFDARPADRPRLSLKQAHQQLQVQGVRVQLAPGDPWSGLQRLANTLVGTDLLIISADVDPHSLERAWFYIPRMLHEKSQVFRQQPSGDQLTLQPVTLAEIQSLAAVQQKAQRRAG